MLPLVLICFNMIAADERASTPPQDSADRAAYEAAQVKAGHDPKAQVRLALWCEAHGLGAERMKHLAMAVLYDPSNGLARGLMGLVAYQGKWKRPDDVSQQVRDDPKRKALMQEYFQRRAKTSEKAEDQWKLALWCEQNGLKDQAIAQYHAVLRRDPSREAAWKRLGFKKVGGRWIKPERQAAQKREAEEQNRANKHWKPRLERLREGLSSRDKGRRASAEESALSVTDPRAVPMIWAVFVPKGAEGQKTAVRLLGQVDAPGASQSLAFLTLMSTSAEVRQDAAQLLRRRDARDFAPFLIGLIRTPIHYEVKRVQGPGKTGELVIKDGTTNRKRLYSPPSAPNYSPTSSDYLSLDASGLPVISRFAGFYKSTYNDLNTKSETVAMSKVGMNTARTSAQIAGLLGQAGVSPALSQRVGATLGQGATPLPPIWGVPGTEIYADYTYAKWVQIPIGEMMLESQRAAQVAELQLAGDVRAIEAYNAPLRDVNRRVRQILSETVGTDKGDDHSAWAKWLVDLFGYAYAPQKSSADETTIIEQVPLSYQPQTTPFVTSDLASVNLHHHACFGAGTPVQTMDGPRPIEDLSAGDEVLTQNPRTGELKYQPLVTVFHNPPNNTFRVELDGESIVATGIHRLWKAGKGWTMVRELKPGDVLRTLGGTATVKSVVQEKVQPVFNLQVAEGESYFVGRSGVLAHDNSTINPTPEPFDAVEPVASPGPPTRRSLLGR